MLIGTCMLVTGMYSWYACRQLAVLIEAEPELQDSQASLLQRAEANIASHLHLQGGGGERGLLPPPPAAAACRRRRRCFFWGGGGPYMSARVGTG